MLKELTKDLPNVEVVTSFDGLLVDYMREIDAKVSLYADCVP